MEGKHTPLTCVVGVDVELEVAGLQRHESQQRSRLAEGCLAVLVEGLRHEFGRRGRRRTLLSCNSDGGAGFRARGRSENLSWGDYDWNCGCGIYRDGPVDRGGGGHGGADGGQGGENERVMHI